MEKIKSHAIADVWRVKEGVLVNVYKYKHTGRYCDVPNSKTKVVRGCTGLRELKEDYESRGEVLKKGTLVLHRSPVEPVTDVSEFKFDVTSSGGSIYGRIAEVERVLHNIQDILDTYKGE
ncbi:hypothetical protein Kirov_140 [Bacillus phage Kirov]|uniref:Uncharacterized protein n=1 Tax=Bacillus phage Kirov TaxID=2783539 RepID=A0A7S6RB72_9CAUD|nr:hypothetical protein PQE67_gp164 [Bacillus phage Kirov]QOV08339.1 hypothetical protein Kirov_140 [Bacillus phage Kirov]